MLKNIRFVIGSLAAIECILSFGLLLLILFYRGEGWGSYGAVLSFFPILLAMVVFGVTAIFCLPRLKPKPSNLDNILASPFLLILYTPVVLSPLFVYSSAIISDGKPTKVEKAYQALERQMPAIISFLPGEYQQKSRETLYFLEEMATNYSNTDAKEISKILEQYNTSEKSISYEDRAKEAVTRLSIVAARYKSFEPAYNQRRGSHFIAEKITFPNSHQRP